MTFQRKLLLGFALMVLPALLVGAEAIRSNRLERRALDALGESMARTRTYAELETAMFDQGEIVWRYLSGLDSSARREFRLSGEVVGYWQERWRAELSPEELPLAEGVARIQGEIRQVTESVFHLADAGRRPEAFALAQRELKGRLQPALTQMNREVYRRARESSVRGAYTRLEEILAGEGRTLLIIVAVALAVGLVISWVIARGLTRPIRDLTSAMAVVGSGKLDHPVSVTSRDEIGELAAAFARMTDSLRRNVAQLERTQAQLVQSEKLASIGEMSAAVAHGLRNPLASLRAAAQLVRRHPDAPSAGEHLQAIVDEVDRLDRRISHLLSFSRPAPYHPMPERLDRLVEGLLPAFAEPLRERGVELQLDLPRDLPEVRVDPMQMEQALLELVSNALDAMPRGGRLRLAALAGNGAAAPGEVVVEVADTGGGIPAHVLPSVCEPFFTTRQEGTGLGLAIAKRFVEQNGGRLEIDSVPGSGTTVRVRLPAGAPG
ncbi:MAG TPA: ATP-binding protein [Gemmatimonadales bacterium]|nr:ATP-binding protein [Gemmatimonadales bacterium]